MRGETIRSIGGRGSIRGGRSSPLPPPPPRSPGSCPSRDGRSRAAAPSARARLAASSLQRREIRPRTLRRRRQRRHRHESLDAHPWRGAASASRNASSSPGARPCLDSSPAALTSTQAGDRLLAAAIEALGGRERRERVHEAHAAHQVACLAALQMPDEVPGEAVAGDRLLGQQLLDAVLAHEHDARVGEHRQVGRLHVLDRRQQLDRVRRPARARRRLGHGRPREREVLLHDGQLEAHAVPPSRYAITAWRPLPAPSRRCEWKRSGSQIVHRPATATSAAPAALQRRGARRPRGRPGRPRPRRRRSARAAARRRPRRPRSSTPGSRSRRRPLKPRPTRSAAASSTPATSPRQPACTTARRVPPGATSAAVRQSAPCAISGRPGSAVTRASPSGQVIDASR